MAGKRPTHHCVPVAVCGSGRFPFDMLRYDQCVPRTASDLLAIWSEDFRVVQLNAYRSRSGEALTEDRWTSFGWFVLTGPELCAYYGNPKDDATKDLHTAVQSRQTARKR